MERTTRVPKSVLHYDMDNVSNSQGRNLGRSVTPARTSGLSSIQGDLGESGLRYLKASLTNANDAQVTETFLTNVKRSIIES